MSYKLLKSVFAVGALTVASLANASATFGGLTFTFMQTNANTLTFNMTGIPSDADGAGWAGVSFLGAFSLKDLGLDFSIVGGATGTANGPGAVNLLGKDSDISASNIDCVKVTGQDGSICFDIAPDVAIVSTPMNFLYTIVFNQNLNIASTGVHLKLAFMNVEGGEKIGSLYSQNVGLGSSSSSSSSGGTTGSAVPEPGTATLALLGLGLIGAGLAARRRKAGR